MAVAGAAFEECLAVGIIEIGGVERAARTFASGAVALKVAKVGDRGLRTAAGQPRDAGLIVLSLLDVLGRSLIRVAHDAVVRPSEQRQQSLHVLDVFPACRGFVQVVVDDSGEHEYRQTGVSGRVSDREIPVDCHPPRPVSWSVSWPTSSSVPPGRSRCR